LQDGSQTIANWIDVIRAQLPTSILSPIARISELIDQTRSLILSTKVISPGEVNGHDSRIVFM
jgi:hypothetical protein